MRDSTAVCVVGCLALLATTAGEVLNGIVAFGSATSAEVALALRILLFVAFGLTIIGVISLTYFIALFTYHVNNRNFVKRHSIWAVYGTGSSFAAITLAISGLTIIWAIFQRQNLPEMILYKSPNVWLYFWLGFWGASLLLQITFFVILGLWIKHYIQKYMTVTADHEYGIKNENSLKVDTGRGRSLDSRDTTLASYPRSPSTNAASSIQGYSSTRNLTISNPRAKLVRKNSARSSLDNPVHSAAVGKVLTMDAFQEWDTSSVHHEMRAAVGSVQVNDRSIPGLDTIPGSRSSSPADPLSLPFEPSSPPVRGTASEQSTMYEMSSPVSHHQPSHRLPSSPPSSPPNFSRPTSKSKVRSFANSSDTTREAHVHPLFRSTSPLPPPIATMGTTVTVASPNEPITPKSLARLRNSSVHERSLRNPMSFVTKGHWRAMPSVDTPSTRPSTAGSTGLGSPGPSIADEEELPPILPGFVLGAGSRSSLIGYSSRKSSRKEKRSSRLSYTE